MKLLVLELNKRPLEVNNSTKTAGKVYHTILYYNQCSEISPIFFL